MDWGEYVLRVWYLVSQPRSSGWTQSHEYMAAQIQGSLFGFAFYFKRTRSHGAHSVNMGKTMGTGGVDTIKVHSYGMLKRHLPRSSHLLQGQGERTRGDLPLYDAVLYTPVSDLETVLF